MIYSQRFNTIQPGSNKTEIMILCSMKTLKINIITISKHINNGSHGYLNPQPLSTIFKHSFKKESTDYTS